MGMMILSLALVIEIAFAAYCIRTKSYAKKIRGIIRIASLGIFTLFTFTMIVKWSFRWYAFFALLLLWAILGVVTFVRKKADTEEYQTKKVIRKAVTACIMIIIVMIPLFIFPPYERIKATGKWNVASEIFTYTDRSRLETYTDTGEN